MMDVYVATKAENYPMARVFMRALEEAGHDITHDWTVTVEELGPGPEDISTRRRSAIADLKGVVECDIFILIMHKDMVGSLIEYGAALALNKPIYIVVDVEDWPVESIFFDFEGLTYHHPSLQAITNAVAFVDRRNEIVAGAFNADEVAEPDHPRIAEGFGSGATGCQRSG